MAYEQEVRIIRDAIQEAIAALEEFNGHTSEETGDVIEVSDEVYHLELAMRELDDIEMGDDVEEVDRDSILHELRDIRYSIDTIEGSL